MEGIPPTLDPPPSSDSQFLAILRTLAQNEKPTVGDLVTTSGASSYGFLIVVLALIAIPFVGISTPFGVLIAGLGVQFAVGRSAPWLPRFVLRRPLPAGSIGKTADVVERRLRWLDRRMRPRFGALLHGAGRLLTGLGVLFLGLGLALPLPIPGSNWAFIVPLVVFGLGILERDGLWVLVGMAGALLLAVLMFLFSSVVGQTIAQMVQRISAWF